MPIHTSVKKNVGVSGPAQVKVLKDALRVIFPDGDQYDVPKNDWGDRPSGNYHVTMSAIGDKILFIQPPGGSTCLVRFAGFGNRQYANKEDKKDKGVPQPYIKRGGVRKSSRGGTWLAPDELNVSARLVVVDESPFKGLSLPYTFPYAFERYEGTNFTAITAKQTRLVKIEEFLRIAGLDFEKDDIPFSDNVLPWLEDRLLKAGKVFSITLNKDGFVSQIVEIPSYLLPPSLVSKNGKAAPKKAKKSK